VNPLNIIEEEVFFQASAGIGNHSVLAKINLFIFDRSPEAFHKDVVIRMAPAIYADFDILLLKHLDKTRTVNCLIFNVF
jgi:hypothetical protein